MYLEIDKDIKTCRCKISAHVPAKTLRLFAGEHNKTQGREGKTVENFTGLINKSNYRGYWTIAFMVAAIDLEIAMTKQFMAQQPVTIFPINLRPAEMS